MPLLYAIFLGVVQGLTEFFPISSSTHLRLVEAYLGLDWQSGTLVSFELTCHLGTLSSLSFFLRKKIFTLLKSPKEWGFYAVALCPLIPAYFLFKPLRESSADLWGLPLLFTSLLLFLSLRRGRLVLIEGESGLIERKKIKDMLSIGVMQALALIPGVSRSGATIAGARFCGWNWKEAAEVSFLLSIPSILGGELIELAKGYQNGFASFSEPFAVYGVGFLSSFLVGLAAVSFAFWVYEKGKMQFFAWYCFALFAMIAYGPIRAKMLHVLF